MEVFMKRIKVVFTSLFLILICVSLLSCQTQPLFEGRETDTTEEICFREIICFDSVFDKMTEENYFDVTNFTVNRFNGNSQDTDGSPVVCFSFVPIELRLHPASTKAYTHSNERFSALLIDGYKVKNELKLLKDVEPIRFLKADSAEKDSVLAGFSEQYGVAYSLSFTHNGKRDNEFCALSEYQTHYDFLISPLTKDNTYYLCDKNTLIVAEVDGDSLAFLKKAPEDWYDRSIFQQHIGLVEKIEVNIKDGTTVGVCGVKNLLLEHRNTDKNGVLLHPLEVIRGGSDAILHITAYYNGETKSIEDILKYRKFYAGILWTVVREFDVDEGRQERLKNVAPDMTVKVFIKCDEYQETLEYRFFADDSVLLNGVYIGKVTDGQIDALMKAVGLMLSSDAADIIDFW